MPARPRIAVAGAGGVRTGAPSPETARSRAPAAGPSAPGRRRGGSVERGAVDLEQALDGDVELRGDGQPPVALDHGVGPSWAAVVGGTRWSSVDALAWWSPPMVGLRRRSDVSAVSSGSVAPRCSRPRRSRRSRRTAGRARQDHEHDDGRRRAGQPPGSAAGGRPGAAPRPGGPARARGHGSCRRTLVVSVWSRSSPTSSEERRRVGAASTAARRRALLEPERAVDLGQARARGEWCSATTSRCGRGQPADADQDPFGRSGSDRPDRLAGPRTRAGRSGDGLTGVVQAGVAVERGGERVLHDLLGPLREPTSAVAMPSSGRKCSRYSSPKPSAAAGRGPVRLFHSPSLASPRPTPRRMVVALVARGRVLRRCRSAERSHLTSAGAAALARTAGACAR